MHQDAYVQSCAFDACDNLKVSEVTARYVKHHAQGLAVEGSTPISVSLSWHMQEKEKEREERKHMMH